MKNGAFIDWLTASQHHPAGGLPIVTGGVFVEYNAQGLPIFERNRRTRVTGSFETAVSVSCDGFRVSLSGNVGRFNRKDNLFNHGWRETQIAANRILESYSLPPFTTSADCGKFNGLEVRGAVISRLDITTNFATGGESHARSFIRWLASRSISRMKRGNSGSDSVWWANTRHMLKAYIKHLEMLAHGATKEDTAYQYCKDSGVVRVEIEIKKRLLSELGLNDWANVSDEKLEQLFKDETHVFRSIDRSDEDDILEYIPMPQRAIACAWLAGNDVTNFASRATLFRHAKILKQYGLDIFQPRNIEKFPVKVRVIDLQALDIPDWYYRYTHGIGVV
jgi:hypothetical protein